MITTADEAKMSDNEATFLCWWRRLAPDSPLPDNYDFQISDERGWRVDFFFRAARLVVEVEGYGHGKDNRFVSDIHKYNWLAVNGIRLFRCTRRMLTDDPAPFIEMVKRALQEATL